MPSYSFVMMMIMPNTNCRVCVGLIFLSADLTFDNMKDYFKKLNSLTLSDMKVLNEEVSRLLVINDEKYLLPEKRMRKLNKRSHVN